MLHGKIFISGHQVEDVIFIRSGQITSRRPSAHRGGHHRLTFLAQYDSAAAHHKKSPGGQSHLRRDCQLFMGCKDRSVQLIRHHGNFNSAKSIE
jgi:hypothetical protein